MAGGNAAAGTGQSQEINLEMPSLLNQMSSEEFRRGDEIQSEGYSATGKVLISQQPGISLCSLLLC